MVNRLNEILGELNIELSDEQVSQFESYYELLVETNKVMNLTAITEKYEVIVKHFADSLELIRSVPDIREKEYSLIYVGTGAGFPGIPLKIAFPKLRVLLLDSLNKRVNFLNNVIEELGLKDIEAVHMRAEEGAANPSYREHFDICVSRAVANLSTLSEYCLPYVKQGGFFIPYKSGEVEDEVKNASNAIRILGGELVRVDSFSLLENERSLVVIEKKKTTPKKYPRKAGLPKKEPL